MNKPFASAVVTAAALAAGAVFATTAHAGKLILNEWNCVGSQKWLGNPSGATAGCPTPDGPGGSTCSTNDDVYFGRVLGNGGDWMELVVTQDHTDIRGWRIRWIETQGGDADGTDIWYGAGNVPQGEIVFSNSAVWADLRAGTIITITENSAALGGLDSDTSFDPCQGDWWINANCFDAALISCNANVVDINNPTYNDPLDIGNDNWAAMIVDANENVVQGLTGEGQSSWGASGVNSREVVRLKENPTATVTAFSSYAGADNSSFGQPNSWTDTLSGCKVWQDLEALRAPVRAELCSACNPIALNEYNAVSATGYLGGGTQAADALGGQAADSFFGRVLGNGGNWFELVVVADHVDMRGWKLEWADKTASGAIQLSLSAALSDMRAGTILTFTQNNTAQGGKDTDLTYSPGTGDIWVNINTFDTALVSGTTSTKPAHISGQFSTSNDKWWLRIRDAVGAVVMTPRGEGSPFYSRGSVGTDDVCRLRADINGRVDASSAYDDDNARSTFGSPNTWTVCPSTTVVTQSLAALPIAGCAYTAPNPADLDHSGTVDGTDLGLLLGNWGNPGVSDLDGNGTTDGTDLGLLLGAWG